jgi:hypothetical protein
MPVGLHLETCCVSPVVCRPLPIIVLANAGGSTRSKPRPLRPLLSPIFVASVQSLRRMQEELHDFASPGSIPGSGVTAAVV